MREQIEPILEKYEGYELYNWKKHERTSKAGQGLCSGNCCDKDPIVTRTTGEANYAFCLYHLLARCFHAASDDSLELAYDLLEVITERTEA